MHSELYFYILVILNLLVVKMRLNIAPCETVLRIWKPTLLVLNDHNRIKPITGWEWHNSKLSTTSREATEVTGIRNELPECYETTKNQVPSVFALQSFFCKTYFHKILTSRLTYCETFLPFEFPDYYNYFILTNSSMKFKFLSPTNALFLILMLI
jgi:hypothetical protein